MFSSPFSSSFPFTLAFPWARRASAHTTASLFCLATGLGATSCARDSGGTVFIQPDAQPSTQAAVECNADASPAANGAPAATGSAGPGIAFPTSTAADAGQGAAHATMPGTLAPTGDDAEGAGDDADGGDADDDSDGGSISIGPISADSADSAAAPGPGDLAITEVMIAPTSPQPGSEWFEVYNLTASPEALTGLTIQDGLNDAQTIAAPGVVVAPFTYALLVRDRSAAAQALLPMAAIVYEYGGGSSTTAGIELDSGAAGDLSLWNGTTLVVDVPYGMWNAPPAGASIELAAPQADPSVPGNWCVAQTPWATGSDDGTPGQPSDCGP